MKLIKKRTPIAKLLYIIGSGIIMFAPVTTAFAAEVQQKPKPTYTYNETTGRWDSNKWTYNPSTGTYEPTKTVVVPAPTLKTAEEQPDSNQAPVTTSSDSTRADTNTTAEIKNDSIATSQSGDATVQSNTSAGSATSGDAHASTTLINNVNSSTSGISSGAATFTSDIKGDVHGDIILYPALIKAMQEASQKQQDSLTMNVNNTTNIVNNIDLSSLSGDATVRNNTSAGNATTGTATAIANVVNVVNSVISANKSFVGTINIYGNLDGDILLQKGVTPQMLMNNAASPLTQGNSLTLTQNDIQTIANNVSLNAQTGQASVNSNTQAGNAKSGEASTNLVILNMSGKQVVASSSLLVFVNVMGTWVGVIVDSPTSARAAVLGTNVSVNEGGLALPDSTTITTNNDTSITNNITLNAQSGDAAVSHNTKAGNATTGNASASATITNIASSSFNLSDWFGILFINVFGTWNGSFDIDTSAGNAPKTQTQQPVKPSTSNTKSTPPKFMEFIPKPPVEPQANTGSSQPTTTPKTTNNNEAVLAANNTPLSETNPITPTNTSLFDLVRPVAFSILFILIVLAVIRGGIVIIQRTTNTVA